MTVTRVGTAVGCVVAALLMAACSSSKAVKTDDMSVAQHEQAAVKEDAQAAEHASRYDPNAAAVRTGGGMDTGVMYNPTEAQKAAADLHAKHAEQHRTAAAALRVFEDSQCIGVPPETRDACPFIGGNVVRTENIPMGVRLVMAQGTDVHPLFRVISCHAAFSRAQHQTTVERCAPYLPLVTVKKSPDGTAIDLTTNVAANVAELRERAAAQVPEQP